MCKEKSSAEKLLERAYALKTDEDSKALYRDWAETYDETMLDDLGYLTPKNTALLLTDSLKEKTAKILDVGCGTGLAGEELSNLGYTNLDALDYSAEMLDVARKRNVYDALFQIDLNEKIDLQSGFYDAMICTGTFTHAHVGAGCLDELFRILKPSGLLACTVHKDIWKSQGFETKVAELETAGVLKTCHHEPGNYYTQSTENEGYYILWEKVG